MPNNTSQNLAKVYSIGQPGILLPETEKILIAAGNLLIAEAQNNLQHSGQNSSGALSAALKPNTPQKSANGITLAIQTAPYYDFVNKGVKGTKGGFSSGGYAFRNSFPSKAMIGAISKWLKNSKHITANTPVKGKITNRRKVAINTAGAQKAAVYAIARSIKVHGIKGNGYLDKALAAAQQYAVQNIGKALANDIKNALQQQ